MSWEYDGNEDEFNDYCNSFLRDDYEDNSPKYYSGIDSIFLDELLPYIESYVQEGEIGLQNLYSLVNLSSEQEKAIEFAKKVNRFLMYDSNGNWIEHYERYLNIISNQSIVAQRIMLNELKDEIINLCTPNRYKIFKRKFEYKQNLNIDIVKNKQYFKFNFEETTYLNSKTCAAIEILALSYANYYTSNDYDNIRFYEGHILKDIEEFDFIDEIIQRIATKLDFEKFISLEENSLNGNFLDGSMFSIYPIYRPRDFGCQDYYELNKVYKEIKYSFNQFNIHLNIRKLKKINFWSYLKINGGDSDFMSTLIESLSSKLTVEIRIPKDSLKINKLNQPYIELKFKLQRSTLFKNNIDDSYKEEILKTKTENSLNSLIVEGKAILEKIIINKAIGDERL